MKRLLSVFAVVLVLSTSTMAVDIAISTKSGWWAQTAADQEMQDIVNNVKGANVEVFTVNQLAALADWVVAHTGDGVPDILIMCGNFPETIYRSGNAQPEGSLAELFLDDGNTIINTGDYIFYVGTTANNDAGGLQNMMDVPAAAMWGDDTLATSFVPTADGQLYTPSLPASPSNRPWFPAQFDGTDWYVELALAQNSDGSQVHPGILRNSVTGGRLGVFFQVADQFADIRGEVISEWINNWYLPKVAAATAASRPAPEYGATDVPSDVVLSWKSGLYAATHDVYFGTAFEDVNNASRTNPMDVLASQGQADATFDPEGLLEYGQTYFWRVDEVNAAPDNTIFKGETWTFTVEPYSYPVTPAAASASSFQTGMGPENTINGSGLNANDEHSTELPQMWMSSAMPQPHWIQYEFAEAVKLDKMLVWNSNQLIEGFIGFGAKSVTIEYSTDGETWTALDGVPEFARAAGSPSYTANTTVEFGGVMARFVKLTVNQTWGGVAPQTGLSEVRFFAVPVQAFAPQPAVAATGVSIDTELSWRPGREAESHEVYLGTDENALALVDTVTGHSYTPASLDLGTTYFWKVNEVGGDGPYEGAVWSFTTEPFVVLDDMDGYNDDDNRIYDSWIDGLTDQALGGSQVGYDVSPFAEKTIVHGGRQSLPLLYNNVASSFSETERTIEAQDWTASGIQSLSLWFHGVAGNSGQLYVKVNGAKVLYDGDQADLARPAWQVWNIDLSQAGNVANVRTLAIGVEGSGTAGTLYIDDVRLYPEAPEYIVPVQPQAANLVAHYTFDEGTGTRVADSSGKGNHGTANGNPKWLPGVLGGAMLFDGSDDFVNCGHGASVSNVESVSVSAWINAGAVARDHKIASNQNNATGGYKLGVYSGNDMIEFEVRNSANAATLNRAAPGGTALKVDTWYHVVGVYEKGQAIRTYVNGRLDRELPTTVVAGISTGDLMLGREAPAGAYWWLGQMDDLRVYNQALTDGEVAGLAGVTKPMHKPF